MAARGAGAILVLAAAVGFVSMSSRDDASGPLEPTLRQLAASRDMVVGTAVQLSALENDPAYSENLAAEYGALTPENEMKWATIEPQPNTFDFGPGDVLVAFARQHGMVVRGHNLTWQEENPPWLTGGHWTRDQLTAILREHILEVVGHYRGLVVQWDVVNEPLADDGSLRPNIWSEGIGPDYIPMAFEWAHQADPAAELFLNEYGIEFGGPKTDAAYRLVARLHAAGVPIDGVGLQMHDPVGMAPRLPELSGVIARFNSLGLDVALTEMDVWLPDDTVSADLGAQARFYSSALAACVSAVRCSTFSTWGFTDRYSWVPDRFPGFTSALPFDSDYRAKPAARAIQTGLVSGRPTPP